MFTAGKHIVVDPEHGQMVAHISDYDAARNVVDWNFADGMRSVVDGSVMVRLPWNEEACRLLKNLNSVDGVYEATPLYHARHPLVEGEFPPMRHQLLHAAFMTLYNRGYILSEPRTGKTGSVILGIDYMRRSGHIVGGVLIITTLTTIHGVWKASIEATLPNAVVKVVHGKERERALAEPADFYITNYESCRLSENAFCEAISEGRIGGVIIDELTHVGNSSSKRHKAIYRICNVTGVPYVLGLTGSPADNMEAVYGMAKVVNPAALPVTTKTAWINLTTDQYGSEPYMRSPRKDAPQIVHRTLQPSIRFRKADVLDLPPVTHQVRECELSPKQERVRKKLKEEAVALLDSGEVITAANGGVLFGKLMQAALGIIKTEQGVVELEHAARTKVLLEAMEETPRKTVVFCHYKAALHMLCREIRDAGYTVDAIDGDVGGAKRAEILRAFQHEKDPHVLVCHPITVGFGTELSAADTMIFAGPIMLGGFTYNQALERLSSARQTADNVQIIHIVASPEEKKALASLRKGHEQGLNIAALFEDLITGEMK